MVIPSRNYFAARRPLLENSQDIKSGAWPISWYRIAKGWGMLPEAFWPNQEDVNGSVITSEPQNADAIAKRFRLSHYQRLRSEQQCVYAVQNQRGSVVSLEISKAWNSHNARRGKIGLASDLPTVAVHTIALKAFDFDSNEFVFPNSWGQDWGDSGVGYLPYGYLTRHMIEGWSSGFSFQLPAMEPGTHLRHLMGESSRLGDTWIVEIHDGDEDVTAAWSFAVRKKASFDIEELFVRPDCRRRGFATKLAQEFLKLDLGVPVQFWIPWGDHEDHNGTSLLRWAQKLELRLEPSNQKWAAYRATLGTPVESLPPLDCVPEKPTSPLHLLDDGLGLHHAYSAAPDILSSGAVLVSETPIDVKKPGQEGTTSQSKE